MEESKHTRIKKDIEEYFKFFEDNIKRHKQSTRFAFKQTLSDEDREDLQSIQKPPIEINYTQAYLSRLLGEFSKQTSEVIVSGNGTGDDMNIMTVSLVEGIMRDIFDQYEQSGRTRQVRKEQCGGCFSVLKCGTEYKNNKSFEQVLTLGKAKDPLMCFFDPMSKLPSKSDGLYCGENYPMTKEEFKKEYPDFAQKADNLNYAVVPGQSFSWSYKNMKEDIVVLSDFYRVEYRKYVLVRLADGRSMRESEYNKMKTEYSELAPIPKVVKRRKIKEKKIKRYVIFGEDIIEEEDTSYPELPYIFVDGDSAFVYKNDMGGEIEQVVHSYIYNAMDAQRVLNSTAQTVANYAENLMQQRYILEQRSIVNPDDWNNPQRLSVLLYNSQDAEGNPIPPPLPVIQAGLPEPIMQTLSSMQQIIENTLGSPSAMQGVSQREVPSGIAMQEGETQNNATSMAFKNGYTDALNAAAKFFIKMIPRVYITPMTVPYMDKEGDRTFIKINQLMGDGTKDPDSMHIDYDDDVLDVKIKSGSSFSIQKDRSLKTMIQLMQVIPSFAQLMNSPKGLPIVIDQLEIRDVDKLKEMAKEQKDKQSQQQDQPNPAQQQAMIQQQELQLKKEELEIKKQKMQMDFKIAMIGLEKEAMNDAVQNEKAQAEINNAKITGATKIADQMLRSAQHEHQEAMDVSKMHR